VVRSQLPPSFSLRGNLGAPKEAAQLLLDTAIAPKGSGRTAVLLSAEEETTANGPLYTFE
jgi:hypothetical protein